MLVNKRGDGGRKSIISRAMRADHNVKSRSLFVVSCDRRRRRNLLRSNVVLYATGAICNRADQSVASGAIALRFVSTPKLPQFSIKRLDACKSLGQRGLRPNHRHAIIAAMILHRWRSGAIGMSLDWRSRGRRFDPLVIKP